MIISLQLPRDRNATFTAAKPAHASQAKHSMNISSLMGKVVECITELLWGKQQTQTTRRDPCATDPLVTQQSPTAIDVACQPHLQRYMLTRAKMRLDGLSSPA